MEWTKGLTWELLVPLCTLAIALLALLRFEGDRSREIVRWTTFSLLVGIAIVQSALLYRDAISKERQSRKFDDMHRELTKVPDLALFLNDQRVESGTTVEIKVIEGFYPFRLDVKNIGERSAINTQFFLIVSSELRMNLTENWISENLVNHDAVGGPREIAGARQYKFDSEFSVHPGSTHRICNGAIEAGLDREPWRAVLVIVKTEGGHSFEWKFRIARG